MPPPTIRSALTLRQIYLPDVDAVRVNWTPRHAMSLNSRILKTPDHPLYDQARRRWEARTDPLWWNCVVSNKMGGNKKVVRTWLARRTRAAFQIALKSKGYTENGARLVKDSGGSAKGDLVGTVSLLVQSEMLQTSWKDLCSLTDLVVAAIEKQESEVPAGNRRERRKKAFEALLATTTSPIGEHKPSSINSQ